MRKTYKVGEYVKVLSMGDTYLNSGSLYLPLEDDKAYYKKLKSCVTGTGLIISIRDSDGYVQLEFIDGTIESFSPSDVAYRTTENW